MWETVVNYLREERAVIRGAPLACCLIFLAGIIASFGVTTWHYEERFSTLQEHISYLDGQVRDYQDVLHVDSPAQAGDKNSLQEKQIKKLNDTFKALCRGSMIDEIGPDVCEGYWKEK